MRLVTTLAIVGVVGSVAVGSVKSYLGRTASNPVHKVSELLSKDRKATTRLIEQATFQCMPGLAKLRNAKTRALLSRMILLSLSPTRSQMTAQEQREAMMKEIQPLLESVPDQDMVFLAKAIKETKKEMSKTTTCIAQTVVTLAADAQTSKPKQLFLDAKLRD